MNYAKTLIFFLLVPFVTFGQDQSKIEAIENGLVPDYYSAHEEKWTLEERMSYYKVPAVSIAVIDDYEIVFAKAYGLADKEDQREATTETAFQAASLSKTVNAAGIFKLVDQDQIDPSADINTYLSSWTFPYSRKSEGNIITTLHLLSHTAGLSTSGFPGYQKGKKIPTINQILDGKKPANTKAVRSQFAPGIKFQYSGGGTMITQKMIEDVTGRSYTDYMNDHVLAPLGMTNSFFSIPDETIKVDLASAHWTNGSRLKGKFHLYPESAPAALWTTPTDMATFLIELQKSYEALSTDFLSQESTKLMMTTPLENTTNANGVFIQKIGAAYYFEHSGSNEGFRSQYIATLEGGKGAVVMVNSEQFDIIPEIIASIANAYEWEGINRPEIKELTDEQKKVDDLVGVYQHAEIPERNIEIKLKSGRLVASESGKWSADLVQADVRLFYLKGVNPAASMEFSKTDGKVTHITSKQSDRITRWNKVK